jgi:hypothetical protein
VMHQASWFIVGCLDVCLVVVRFSSRLRRLTITVRTGTRTHHSISLI